MSGLLFVVLEAGLSCLLIFKEAVLQNRFPLLMEELSLFERFYVFIDGVFDVTAIVYFLSVIVVFVFLTIQSMEKRRWN